MTRKVVVKVRLSEGEASAGRRKAESRGMALADYMRLILRDESGCDPEPEEKKVRCPICGKGPFGMDEYSDHGQAEHLGGRQYKSG